MKCFLDVCSTPPANLCHEDKTTRNIHVTCLWSYCFSWSLYLCQLSDIAPHLKWMNSDDNAKMISFFKKSRPRSVIRFPFWHAPSFFIQWRLFFPTRCERKTSGFGLSDHIWKGFSEWWAAKPSQFPLLFNGSLDSCKSPQQSYLYTTEVNSPLLNPTWKYRIIMKQRRLKLGRHFHVVWTCATHFNWPLCTAITWPLRSHTVQISRPVSTLAEFTFNVMKAPLLFV